MLWLLAVLQIWVADESEKVRPDARPPSAAAQAPRLRLVAAGGECVGAQVVVRGPLSGLTASARGKAQLDLYRVGTIFLEHPSGPEGATGEWPDALIPARDPIYGEERRAFPVDVPEGRAQAIFVEEIELRVAPFEPKLDPLALEGFECRFALGAVNGRPKAETMTIDAVHRRSVELGQFEGEFSPSRVVDVSDVHGTRR